MIQKDAGAYPQDEPDSPYDPYSRDTGGIALSHDRTPKSRKSSANNDRGIDKHRRDEKFYCGA